MSNLCSLDVDEVVGTRAEPSEQIIKKFQGTMSFTNVTTTNWAWLVRMNVVISGLL